MRQERDLRAYAKTTQKRLFMGILVLLFLIGDGLVFLLWGKEAGRFALVCTAISLLPLLLIFSFLWFFGWLARKRQND